MAAMLFAPKGKAALGDPWACGCRQCRYIPGRDARQARRRLKRRERQAWKGHGRRGVAN